MAKKTTEPIDSPIKAERTDWGVQLTIHPFQGISSANGSDAMRISADVARPRKGRKAEIRYWFSGVIGSPNLTPSEVSLWQTALRSSMAEAQRVGDTMRPAKAR